MEIEEEYKFQIREGFYFFLTKTQYLENAFIYAQKYRFNREVELNKILVENRGLNRSEFVEKYGEEFLREHANNELFFTHMLIHSIFVSAYSYLEQQLASISERLEENSNFSIKNISKGPLNINKYRKYLEKAHHLKNAEEKDNDLWLQINEFRQIRNRIVHHAGRLSSEPEDRKENAAFLSSFKVYIDPNSFEFYIRDEKFLTDYFKLIKSYIQNIVEEVAPVPPLPNPGI